MSLTLGLNAAISGLLVSQRALDNVSHNIANVNTPGATRKIFAQESRALDGKGVGVQISGITRSVDENLVKDIRQETSLYQKFNTLNEYFDRMQDLFGTPEENRSISHTMTSLQESLESLASDPVKAPNHWSTVRAFEDVSGQFEKMTSDIQRLRLNADKEIETAVSRVNELLGDINTLNGSIVQNGTMGRDTTDLEDKRDTAMNELASLIDYNYYKREDNSVVVFTNQGKPLIDNNVNELVYSASTNVSSLMTLSSGDFAQIKVEEVSITTQIGNGKIKALLELRDETLPGMQAELDELAYQTQAEMNKVHNRGTNFPNMTRTMTGTRTFLDSSTQTMALSSGDSAVTLFDTDGNQQATTTITDIMVGAGGAVGGAWTIDNVAANLQTWLRANGTASATVAVNSDGKMAIELNSTTRSLTFRDQSASTQYSKYYSTSTDAAGVTGTVTFRDSTGAIGTTADLTGMNITQVAAAMTAAGVNANVVHDASGYRIQIEHGTAGTDFLATGSVATTRVTLGIHGDAEDVGINFNADPSIGANTTTDETAEGFSNFFGLNDVYTTTRAKDIWDSGIMSTSWTATAATTISFSDSTGLGALGSIAVAAGDTLSTIASAINASTSISNISAYVISEGGGERLRIKHTGGTELLITKTGGAGTFIDDISLKPTAAGKSAILDIRSDIKDTPALISRGAVQYNNDSGKFQLSSGDNQNALAMAASMSDSLTFRKAGAMVSYTVTYAEYGASIISNNATSAEHAATQLAYQKDLKSSLEFKSNEVSGINLDEELSQLILYQQSYSASAKVISTIQQMFDTLNGIIR